MTPYYDDGTCVIYHGDCADVMGTVLTPGVMRGESVNAIVTSPPYADQRRYGGAAPDEYAAWLGPFLSGMIHVVRPSGALMLNIGRCARNGEECPIAVDALNEALRRAWRLLDTIIWHKPNSLPWSSTDYLHSAHEYVWWLAAPGPAKPYRGYTAETRGTHAESSLARWKQGYRRTEDERYYKRGKKIADPHPQGTRPKTVFEAAIGTERGLDHPAPMALKLARHLVALSSPPGDIILDPFAGSGSTLLAAKQLGRKSIGIELNERYCEIAANRLAQGALDFGGVA